MATLVLQSIGAVAGQFLGGPIGAAIGQTIGAVAGSAIDQRLFAPGGRDVSGPRLTSLSGIASNEGPAIARVYGRARVGGQMIWATRFEETSSTSRVGGKGGGGGASSSQTTYNYNANFAVGLSEGPIGQVRRIWADGREIDQTRFNIRLHQGHEDQPADPLIIAKEGADYAPCYRELAYVVFEKMPLAEFGNRVPQLSFEVVRPLGGLCEMIRAVDIIPGSGEFAYATSARFNILELGGSTAENRHNLVAESDWSASLDQLQATCPNLRKASLVVSWFGDDLRAGQCTIAPRVESQDKVVSGETWSVAGVERAVAKQSSRINGRPAYGGTPSDASIKAAIADLKARGIAVALYPFVMMDIPSDNTLSDPWTGAASQPAYPWRGRITCDPAPGRPQSSDANAAAGVQVSNFFGARVLEYNDWSYRRFILHYARLCADAGGVDAFLIGSELVGLIRVRSASGVYPAVQELIALAFEVKAILGPNTKVSYAADWTEYGAHVLDGGAEVRFPLDALWASPAIDAIGIDFWAPLSDWRDGDHLDARISNSIYQLDYLRSRMDAGEAFDFYYASIEERNRQVRTPIEARSVEPSIFEHPARNVKAVSSPRFRVAGPPLVRILDLAFVRPDGFALQNIAVFSDPWPGPMAVWRAEGDGFAFLRTIEQPAMIGETLEPFGVGVTSRFDRANSILLRLGSGSLASVDPSQALAGRTAFALRRDNGWEVLSFVFADLVAPRTWRLSKLLRGLGGQDRLGDEVIPAGAEVVFLDSGVVPLVTDINLIDAPQTYRIAAASAGHGDPSAIEVTTQARNLALLPYAPVRASARRGIDGVQVSFIRRGRIEADGWTSLEAPLGEESESYEIEVLRDGVALRVLRSNAQFAFYSSAEELEDFSSHQSHIRVRIFQMSSIVGRGFAYEELLQIM